MMLTKRRKIGDFSDEELSSEKMKLEDEFRQIIEDTDWDDLKIISRNNDSFCISEGNCVTSADLFKKYINRNAYDESASGNESNGEYDAEKLMKDEYESNFEGKYKENLFKKKCNNLSVSGLLSKIKPLVPTNENLRLLFTEDSNDKILSSQNGDRKNSRKFKRSVSYNKPSNEESKSENSDKKRIIINWDNKCANLFDSLMKNSLITSKPQDETDMENGEFSEKENEEMGNNIKKFRLEIVNLNLPTDTENIKFRVNVKNNTISIIRPNNIIEVLKTLDGKLYQRHSVNETQTNFKDNSEVFKSRHINNSNNNLESYRKMFPLISNTRDRSQNFSEKCYSRNVRNNYLHSSRISLDHNYCQPTSFKYGRYYAKLPVNQNEFSSNITNSLIKNSTHFRNGNSASASKIKNIDPNLGMVKKQDLIIQQNNCVGIQSCDKKHVRRPSTQTCKVFKSNMKVSDTEIQVPHRENQSHMLDRRKVGEQIQLNSALNFVSTSNVVLASSSSIGKITVEPPIFMSVNSHCESQTFQNFSSDNLSDTSVPPFNASFHIPTNISEPAINSTIANQLQNNRMDFDSTISTLVDLVKKADPSEVNKAIQKFHSDLRLKNLNSPIEECVPVINNNESVPRHDKVINFKPLKLKILSPETINRNVLNSKCLE